MAKRNFGREVGWSAFKIAWYDFYNFLWNHNYFKIKKLKKIKSRTSIKENQNLRRISMMVWFLVSPDSFLRVRTITKQKSNGNQNLKGTLVPFQLEELGKAGYASQSERGESEKGEVKKMLSPNLLKNHISQLLSYTAHRWGRRKNQHKRALRIELIFEPPLQVSA